jgi:hypothetical protein
VAALHARSPIVEAGLQVEPLYDPDINMAGLAELQRSGVWKPRSGWLNDPANRSAVLAGSLQFGVVVRTDGPTAASNNVRLLAGCTELRVAPGEPAEFTVAADAPAGFARVAIVEGASATWTAELVDGTLRTEPRDLGTVGTQPVWLGVDPYIGTAIVRFEAPTPARIAICGTV